MKLALLLSRLLLAAIFLYAGGLKLELGASERFTITVAQFAILPPAWTAAFAITLPWAEVLAGVLLLIPRTARLGAIAAGVMLLTFIAALAWAWSQAFTMDCGCFGSGEPISGDHIPYAIVRDIVLLAITLPLALRRSR